MTLISQPAGYYWILHTDIVSDGQGGFSEPWIDEPVIALFNGGKRWTLSDGVELADQCDMRVVSGRLLPPPVKSDENSKRPPPPANPYTKELSDARDVIIDVPPGESDLQGYACLAAFGGPAPIDDKPFTLEQIADAIMAVAKHEASFTGARVAILVYRDGENAAKIRDDSGNQWSKLEAYFSAKMQEVIKSG